MIIERHQSPSAELYAAFQRLIPQLTKNHPAPSYEEITMLVNSPNSIVLTARFPDHDSPIIGTATIGIWRVPTGIHAHLEDVIVDETMRGLGIGAELTMEAVRYAKLAGANGVMLTSNQRRIAANSLYQKLGFKRWDTNLYFYTIQPNESANEA